MRAAALALSGAVCSCAAPATQAGSCPGVGPDWAVPSDGLPHNILVNRVSVAGADRLRWNGEAISRAQLREYLTFVRGMRPRPFTILQPDRNVDCIFLEAVRADMEATLPCDEGACGEGRGRWGDGTGRRRLSPQAESDRANAIAEMDAAAEAVAAGPPER